MESKKKALRKCLWLRACRIPALLGLSFSLLAAAGGFDIKFTTYNLDVKVGDTINILNYIETDGAVLGTDFELYYTDGETWHLIDFNNNSPVVLVNSDLSGGNKSEGEYRISLRFIGSDDSEDHMTIRIKEKKEKKSEKPKIEASMVPNGIWIQGCLLFNFTDDWSATDKLVNTASININWASLNELNTSDSSTFNTGYPPTISDPSKDWTQFDITDGGHENFTSKDDLPAIMYNIGIFDIHGPANVCGAVYSPSFMEIENKQNNQLQYFKGMVICGGGIYLQNHKNGSVTIVSYDGEAIDKLATSNGKGKKVKLFSQQ